MEEDTATLDPEEPEVGDEGNTDDDYNSSPPLPHWSETRQHPEEFVFVETGRGTPVRVAVGSPFVPTLNQLADDANYGGWFRIFLNSVEIVSEEEAPSTIEANMRIIITPYDKPGK